MFEGVDRIFPNFATRMNRTCFLLLVTMFSTTELAPAQVMVEFTETETRLYALTGGDEFNGSILNEEKWMTAYPWGRHLYCSLDENFYTEAGVGIKEGILTLEARKSAITARAIPYEPDDFIIRCEEKPPAKNLMTLDYQSGMIYSREKFTYGYYEVLFRADAGEGLWPACWLFGADNQEIDIFEIGGRRTDAFHVDVHCKTGCRDYRRLFGLARTNWGDYMKTNTDWSASYHRAAVHWTQDGITWRIDGTPVAWWKGHFRDPLAIICNLAVTGKKGSLGGKISAQTPLPARFNIGYIRIWQECAGATLSPLNTLASDSTTTMVAQAVKLKRKNRPEYNKRKLNNACDQLFLYFTDSNNLLLQIQSNNNDPFTFTISDNTGTLLQTTTAAGLHHFPLTSLGTGRYLITLQKGQLRQGIPLEMP